MTTATAHTTTRLSELVSPSSTEPAALAPIPPPPVAPPPVVPPPVEGKIVVFENVVEHSLEIGEFIGALAKAQGQFKQIERTLTASVTSNRTGGTYTYDYAPLDVVFDAVRPALAESEIAYMQFPSARPNSVTVVTFLAHSSGQWFRSRLQVGGPEHGDPQAVKSATTYARRIAFESILGISPAHDDDGEAAQHAVQGNGRVRSGPGPVQMPQREQTSAPRPAAPASPATSARTAPPPAPGPQTAAGFSVKHFERRKRATGGEFALVQFSTGQVASSTRPEMMNALERAWKAGTRYADVVLTKKGDFTYIEELVPMGGA